MTEFYDSNQGEYDQQDYQDEEIGDENGKGYDPELDSLPPQTRTRIILAQKARRFITGKSVFMHGKGYDEDSPIATVVDTFQTWYHFPDPALILVSLGNIAAHLLPGSPSWLMLVGQQSSGKTVMIESAMDIASSITPVVPVSTFNEASLLSGTPSRDRSRDSSGGLLRLVEPHGILLMKEFTSILSMDREQRNKCISALREIHDGSWTRNVGSDGGKTLRYEGKCSVLAGCTFVIDRYQSLMVDMGERFLYYRLPLVNGYAQARKSAENQRYYDVIQSSTRSIVTELFDQIKIPDFMPSLQGDDLYRMTALSNIVTECRTTVERDFKNQIVGLYKPEGPARNTKGLTKLYFGMRMLGIHKAEAWRITRQVALDSMSATRTMIIQALTLYGQSGKTAKELAAFLRYPVIPIQRGLEDMEALYLAERVKEGNFYRWHLSKSLISEYQRAFPRIHPDIIDAGKDELDA